MLPDLVVIVLKVRDYALWLGPAYLLALALGAVLQVALGARLSPVAAGGRTPQALWLRSLACGLAPASLLLPALFSGALVLARAGGVLLVSTLLVAGVALLVPAGPGAPGQAAPAESILPRAGATAWRNWATAVWQLFRQAVDADLNRFLLGGAVGGLILAWPPGIWLGAQLAGPSLAAALGGALLGLALPLNGGTVLPVIAALLTRGAGPAAVVALLVAAPLLNWWDLRPLARQYGLPVVLLYVGLGLVGAMLLGFLVAQLPGSAQLSVY